jgi:hypothetical protein
MKRLVAIWLMIAVLPAACNYRQQQQQQAAADAPASAVGVVRVDTVIVHDTIIIIQYVAVADSAYADTIRARYEKSIYGYLKELVRMDSLVALLWDGVGMLIDENQSVAEKSDRLQAQVVGLQQSLSVMATPPALYSELVNDEVELEDKREAWRIRAQRLLKQPRTIYTVGADDEAGEVEIINSSIHGSEMYVAVEIGGKGENAKEVAAYLNGSLSPYQYIEHEQKGRVFMFALPNLNGAIKLKFVVDGRNYLVKTNVKILI